MKAKCRILYSECNLCYDKPGTFQVQVIRWSCKDRVVFTLNVDRVTDTEIDGVPGVYKLSYERDLLDVKSDGEAIRAGVERFIELDTAEAKSREVE